MASLYTKWKDSEFIHTDSQLSKNWEAFKVRKTGKERKIKGQFLLFFVMHKITRLIFFFGQKKDRFSFTLHIILVNTTCTFF